VANADMLNIIAYNTTHESERKATISYSTICDYIEY
jgi:hypothetical protein